MKSVVLHAIRALTRIQNVHAPKTNTFFPNRKLMPHCVYQNQNTYNVMHAIGRNSFFCPGIDSRNRNISTCTQKLAAEEEADAQPITKEEKEEAYNANAAAPPRRKKPLFTKSASLSQLTQEDVNTYITVSEEDLTHSIGEGLPAGLSKEYEETKGSSLLVRASFLELRDELKACVEKAKNPSAQLGNPRKQFILDGPVSSGKSITLAMLVYWARAEGWFVFYVPNGKEWTHGGFYYKNPVDPSWDTPKQAITVLERLKKSHDNILRQLPCKMLEPITLGEGPGIGMMKDAESVSMPKGSTLFDLVQTGLTCSHAAVGVVVRLREELSLVKEVPVLFVIDQYNSWFTFSQYKEYTGRRSHRDIHARELTMVKPYRSMLHSDMMVAAYSHSTAVGKLRKHLPDTPLNVRYDFPRYSIDEAEAVINYYSRQTMISNERFSEDKWKRIYYLANGNGSEIRNLVHFL